MSSGTRLVVVLACGSLLLAGATAALVGWMFFGPGALVLEVHERGPRGGGTDIALRVPGIAVRAVLACVPRASLAEASAEAREALPAALAAVDALDSSPDAVLVEVERPGERVEIAKHGSRLLVRVESGSESVRAEVPIRYARWVLEAIADAVPAPSRQRV